MRRANSTPPPITPTKLRSKLTPTAKDRGLIGAASIARARLAAEVNNNDLHTSSHNLPIPRALSPNQCSNVHDLFTPGWEDGDAPRSGLDLADVQPNPCIQDSSMPADMLGYVEDQVPISHSSPRIQNPSEPAEKLGCVEDQVQILHPPPHLPSHPPLHDPPSHHLPPLPHDGIPLTHFIPPTPLPQPHQATHVASNLPIGVQPFYDLKNLPDHLPSYPPPLPHEGIPLTRVIPPTPLPQPHQDTRAASSVPIGVQPYYDPRNLHDGPGEGPSEGPGKGTGDDTNKGGRTTNTNTMLIKEAFGIIESVFVDLSRRTDIDVAPLIERWMKSNVTVASQRSNRWNQYGKYFRTNQQDELARTLLDPGTADGKDCKYHL